MATPPLSAFDDIFAQLTQGMSAARGSPVVNLVSWQIDAQPTTVDRVQWLPQRVVVEGQNFELPGVTTPWRQACSFDVHIYGSSFDRVLGLHGLLVGWLDIIVGPPQGGPPSDDAGDAALRGTGDLAALVYPYNGLVGLNIKIDQPGARALDMPAAPINSPQEIASAINLAAQATGGPVALLRARIVKVGAARFLELLMPTDPLGTDGSTLTIDPTAADSACAILGFSSGADNITATGSPATRPYRPGYLVGDSDSIGGGNASAQTWGLVVPVTLFLPITSIAYPMGVIASTGLQVAATGGDEPDEVVVEVTASAAA